MATEKSCPVCGEALGDSPARCFRCETALGSWWRFEDAMDGLSSGGRPSASALMPGLAVGLALVALLLGAALLRRPAAVPEARPSTPAPHAPPPSLAAPTATPARAISVRYTVQPGDSPWRIAAALLGDGRRWRELWPGSPPRLVPGMVLDLAVGAEPR